MMKKVICLSVVLVMTHGTALSMVRANNIKKALHLQSNKRVMCTGLKDDIRDAASIRSANMTDNLMDSYDRNRICNAHIKSIYQVARIEAMCKIQADPNLSWQQKRDLVALVPTIVRE
jgi:nitrogenase subunit NifH